MAEPTNDFAADADFMETLTKMRPQLRELAHTLFRDTGSVSGSDMVQEVYLEALRCPQYVRDGNEHLKWAWLKKCLAGVIHNTLRDRQRLKRDVRRKQPLGDIDPVAPGAAGQPTVDLVLTAEEVERLVEAVERLLPAYRNLIEWHYWDGESFADIARRMHFDPSSVLKMMQRAEQKLLESLADTHTAVA